MSIVPSSALQVDIYVTNFDPVPLRHPAPLAPLRARSRSDREPAKSDVELQPPHPNFIREDSTHVRSRSIESVESHESYESDVDLSYYLGEASDDEPPADEMHVAHETNILDLTNFDGDVDMALSPEEAYLSHRLRKEGKLRRQQSRGVSGAGRMKQDIRLSRPLASSEARTRHVQDPRQAYPDQYTSRPPRSPQLRKIVTLSTQSTDRLLPISPLSERPQSASSETDLYSPLSHRSLSPLPSHPLSSNLPSTVSLVAVHGSSKPPVHPTKSYHDVKPEPGKPLSVQIPSSTTHVHLQDSHAAGPSTAAPSVSEARLPFEMDDQEASDVHVVSEHARPGKPKLDKVIADEVQASMGAIVVACPWSPFQMHYG